MHSTWRFPLTTAAVGLALVAAIIPALLIGRIHNHYVWRIVVTVALVIYSYLFVFISGGSIEMHFHFFIVASLLVIYSDWRLGWILLVLTGLHHGILNYVEPGWVYYYGRNDFSVVAHAIPVLAAVIFTTYLCRNGRNTVLALKDSKKGLESRTVELEKLKGGLEETVTKRTDELAVKLTELENTNKLMVDRELKMIELKKEIEVLQAKVQPS